MLKYLGVAVVGGVLGAMVGLLAAPAPGRDTRRKLARRWAEEKETLLRKSGETLARISDSLSA